MKQTSMKHKYPYSLKSNWQEKQIVINHNNEKSQIAKQVEWLLSWAGPVWHTSKTHEVGKICNKIR